MRNAPRTLWAYALISVAQRFAEAGFLGRWVDAPFVIIVAVYSSLVLCGWRILWQIAIVFEVAGLFLFFGRNVPAWVAVCEAVALICLLAPTSQGYFRPGYYWLPPWADHRGRA